MQCCPCGTGRAECLGVGPADLSCVGQSGRTDRNAAGDAVPADHWPADDGETIVSRLRQVSSWILGTMVGALAGPAFAQNLDAGKPAAQIFSEVCAGCHRSVR